MPHKTNENMPIVPPPERLEIEKEVHDLFTNGDLSDIARLMHKDASTVSRAFSPWEPDRTNPVFAFISYLWAFDAIRDGLAGEVINIVLREREKWLPARKSDESPEKLTGDILKQFSEFMECELSDKDWHTKVAEITDVIRAAENKKADIIAQRNDRNFGVVR